MIGQQAPVWNNWHLKGFGFHNAYSTSVWSLPGHASLFTGLYPSRHGAHGESLHLSGEVRTIAEQLEDAGWVTAAFTANPFINRSLGLGRGFQTIVEAWQFSYASESFVLLRALRAVGLSSWSDKGGEEVVSRFDRWVGRPSIARGSLFCVCKFDGSTMPRIK